MREMTCAEAADILLRHDLITSPEFADEMRRGLVHPDIMLGVYRTARALASLESRLADVERERDEAREHHNTQARALATAQVLNEQACEGRHEARCEAARERKRADVIATRLARIEAVMRTTLETAEMLLRYFDVEPADIDAKRALAWSKHALVLAEMRATLRSALEGGGNA